MDTVPLAEAKDRLSALVGEISTTHAHYTITRNGRPAVVIGPMQEIIRGRQAPEPGDIVENPVRESSYPFLIDHAPAPPAATRAGVRAHTAARRARSAGCQPAT